MIFRQKVIAVLALGLAGCATGPAYERPSAPVPESWPTGAPYLLQNEAELPAVSYADIFQDPRLNSLIEQGLANNRNLRIAAANITAARAQVRVVRSAQFPEIGASASADLQTIGGGADRQSYALQGGISSFELDLFGRLAGATEAERERALATEADARTVRLALISDLAAAWAIYGADRDLLAIAAETATNARRAVELTQLRLDGGVAPRTDVRQAEQVLATAEGDFAAQSAAVAQDENLIRLLLGGPVDPALLPVGLDEVFTSIATMPAGTDSSVLLRRPDIVRAEYLLRAANADIGVARAELFPRISLTGLLGLASEALGALISSDALSLGAGAGAAYTIFDGGGRRANVEVSEAQREAALASYELAIQSAFREVSDELATQGTMGEQLRAATANSVAAADSAALAEARYRGGIESFLANLDAQRSLYDARRRESAVRLAAVQNRIDLYRALGADIGSQAPVVQGD